MHRARSIRGVAPSGPPIARATEKPVCAAELVFRQYR